jgi:voltage-gated potassium channel
VTVAVGVLQTVDGEADTFSSLEWIAVIIFTGEYLTRLFGAGADPEFAQNSNPLTCRLRFIVSFYSVVDLLAIVPFYLAIALPNSIVDQYDESLRMLRLLRKLAPFSVVICIRIVSYCCFVR